MLAGPPSTSQGPSGKDFGSKLSNFGATSQSRGWPGEQLLPERAQSLPHTDTSCGRPVLAAGTCMQVSLALALL